MNELNNVAASFICEGNFSQAINELKLALTESRQQIVSNTPSCAASTTLPFASTSGVAPHPQQQQRKTLDDHMKASTRTEYDSMMLDCQDDDCVRVEKSCSSNNNNNNDTCFIYRRPISVSPVSDADVESNIVASAAILFNMALSYHLAADSLLSHKSYGGDNDTNCRRRSYLLKAAKLYEYGYIMEREELSFSSPLYTMATVNNMAVVYQSLNDHASSQGLFQNLLSTIMFLLTCGESACVGSSNFDGFIRNVSKFIGTRPTAAAA